MTPVHTTRASSNFSNSYEFASHRRVERTRSQSRTAGDERAIGEGLQGLSQHRWRIDEDLFERAHRGGAGFDRAISCDFELPHHLDGAVGRLGRRGGLPREHRAGGRLSVDSVRLARGSTQTPIDSIHFHDPMTRAVDRTGQADAVAAGPFNADGLDATIRLGPGEQRSIPVWCEKAAEARSVLVESPK